MILFFTNSNFLSHKKEDLGSLQHKHKDLSLSLSPKVTMKYLFGASDLSLKAAIFLVKHNFKLLLETCGISDQFLFQSRSPVDIRFRFFF